ncbi:MAG: DUF4347 domain-containing protein [Acidovorax sp.]|nr:DUF4347 domain-containing protein [Acidovorax sp.]MBL7090091.1 DUF4347 domain-containing protein [Acidovorax sp.]
MSSIQVTVPPVLQTAGLPQPVSDSRPHHEVSDSAGVACAAEVVFIGGNVDASDLLVHSLRCGVEWVLLDPAGDGLRQMVEHLDGRAGTLEALHIVTHGRPGMLDLGVCSLTLDQLDVRHAELQQLGGALAPNASMLLYGCSTGQGEVGAKYVELWAKLAGCHVSASSHLVGANERGGSWDLDVRSGPRAPDIGFRSVALDAYPGLLAISDENFDDESQNVWISTTSQIVGDWIFSGIGSTPLDFAIINAADFGPAQLADNNGDLSFLWNVGVSGVANTGSFAFRAADGTNFDLNSFSLASADGGSMSVMVQGWRDNVQVVSGETVNLTTSDSAGNIIYTLGATTIGVGSYGQLSFGSAFDNVDEIRLVFSATSTAEIDDINISPAFVTPPSS